ncbi:MAG: NepR family anti-sigma factor [Janthinobacterium lividum]
MTGIPSHAGGATSIEAVLTMAQDETAPRSRRRGQKAPAKPAKGEAAFDLWLDRGLHKLFDEVANEPVPDEFLRMIEDMAEEKRRK